LHFLVSVRPCDNQFIVAANQINGLNVLRLQKLHQWRGGYENRENMKP
jgi:hypothetical protein